MNKPYRLPSVEILTADRVGDVATVVVDISREDYLGYPVAPADLWRRDTNERVWQFHQLIAREGQRLVFETYDGQSPLPEVRLSFDFCSWWLPEAMNAVRDTSVTWELLPPPDDDCNRCLLTYEAIAVASAHKEAYKSEYGWITVAAYREFIERDVLRVRSNWKSAESVA